jgi:hypothetical protein
MALNSGIQTYQILTNDDEVCIPSLSSIRLAVSDDTYNLYSWEIAYFVRYLNEIVAEVEAFDPHDFNLKPNRNA